MRAWPRRRWVVALLSAVAAVLVVGVPTDLVPNAVFGREVPPTAWAWPALLASAVLGGLLAATYVRPPEVPTPQNPENPSNADDLGPGARRGWLGATLTYFAVGCPVCNKIVLLALGSAGALTWFEPVQPFLQVIALGLLGWALLTRLRGEVSCPLPAGRG
ncbi:hypothetical protein E8D37_08650 [Nocardioides sp. GY 10127]|nr:hypothetical protein E8D37_08650 [Nocardioides sp. GY 10127]